MLWKCAKKEVQPKIRNRFHHWIFIQCPAKMMKPEMTSMNGKVFNERRKIVICHLRIKFAPSLEEKSGEHFKFKLLSCSERRGSWGQWHVCQLSATNFFYPIYPTHQHRPSPSNPSRSSSSKTLSIPHPHPLSTHSSLSPSNNLPTPIFHCCSLQKWILISLSIWMVHIRMPWKNSYETRPKLGLTQCTLFHPHHQSSSFHHIRKTSSTPCHLFQHISTFGWTIQLFSIYL